MWHTLIGRGFALSATWLCFPRCHGTLSCAGTLLPVILNEAFGLRTSLVAEK